MKKKKNIYIYIKKKDFYICGGKPESVNSIFSGFRDIDV